MKWTGNETPEPECCDFPMQVQEYDKDSDTYLYLCQVTPSHYAHYKDDEEVWK